MRKILTFLGAALLILPSMPVAGQEIEADPITEVKRYKVYFYKFVPGGADRVREILWDVFLPAMRETDTPLPTILHPDDGEWDMVTLFPLLGGYTDLHFNSSPTDAKW